MSERKEIIRDLASVINRHSLENDSNTPDFLLAEYLLDSLDVFTKTSVAREKWYGKKLEIKYDEMGGMLETPNDIRKRWGYGDLQNDKD